MPTQGKNGRNLAPPLISGRFLRWERKGRREGRMPLAKAGGIPLALPGTQEGKSKMEGMKSRQIQRWAAEWFAVKRPNEIRPFFVGALLEDFQRALEEMNHADAEGKEPKDDQQQHQGISRRQEV